MSKTKPEGLYRGCPRIRFLHPWKLRIGGASRDRTDDLKLAKLALSQLSYGPTRFMRIFTNVRTDERDRSCGGPRRS